MHGRPPIAAFLHRLRTREAEPPSLPSLSALLEQRGLTIGVRTLQRYESGDREPPADVLATLVDVLGGTEDDWTDLYDALRAVHAAPPGPATRVPPRAFRARQLRLTAGARARAWGAA